MREVCERGVRGVCERCKMGVRGVAVGRGEGS